MCIPNNVLGTGSSGDEVLEASLEQARSAPTKKDTKQNIRQSAIRWSMMKVKVFE
jgi:hypothetical protein